jgi:hypothetical protein
MNHGDELIKRSGSSNIPFSLLPLALSHCLLFCSRRAYRTKENEGRNLVSYPPDHRQGKGEMTDSLS